VHGRIAGVGGGIAPFVSQPFVTTTRLSRSTPGEASCGVLTLRLGTINLSLRGLAIDLVPIRLDTTGLTGGRQQRLAGELCRLVALLNGTASLAAVQALLVEINRTLAAGLITLPKA
jgi:hypothetical protein